MGADEFGLALADLCDGWPALKPPRRLSVSQAASEYLKIARPGGGAGNYRLEDTPYMAEPADVLASRAFSGCVFVGPAQSGKTVMLGEGWMTYAVLCDPGDMLAVQMTQDKAREYSKTRVDRALRASPDLKAMMTATSRDDNTFDKQFRNGMWLRIAWPTVTNFSSSSYRYVFGTDYDRWPDNIDGEGDGWGLLSKRPATFGSRGMVCVESSPGRDVAIPDWQPVGAHEAPPVGGVLGVYNTSDRRRLMWKCPHCREWFEAKPGLSLFRLPPDEELIEGIRDIDIGRFASQYARVICPVCDAVIERGEKAPMNRGARWMREGLAIDHLDRLSGNPRQSMVAGFWLGGVAATFQRWDNLIEKHLNALSHYALTGEEMQLQSTANTDQAMPYTPRFLVESARKHASRTASEYDVPRYVVPRWARFLVAAVDVQGGTNARFVVQVHAVGADRQQALVDRYSLTESEREGVDDRRPPIDPAGYAEDWDVLEHKVVRATYRIEGSDAEMRVHLTLVDSAGEDGVTDRAYAWFRRLREKGLDRQVRLTKGNGGAVKVDWLFKESRVGGKANKGDVTLTLINTDRAKDMVDTGLRRLREGPGYYHFPKPKGPSNPEGWLPSSFFDELRAEVRNEKGVWVKVRVRNESLDLCAMITVGINMLGCDRRGFWDDPPAWARPHDEDNDNVVTKEQRREDQRQAREEAAYVRRSHASPYLA